MTSSVSCTSVSFGKFWIHRSEVSCTFFIHGTNYIIKLDLFQFLPGWWWPETKKENKICILCVPSRPQGSKGILVTLSLPSIILHTPWRAHQPRDFKIRNKTQWIHIQLISVILLILVDAGLIKRQLTLSVFQACCIAVRPLISFMLN